MSSHICGLVGEDPDGTCIGCANARSNLYSLEQMVRMAKERRKKPFTYEGVDLVKVMREFRRLPAFQDTASRHRLSNGKLRVRYSATRWGAWGRAASGGTVKLSIGGNPTLARVLETLLHEVVHCSLPPEEHHGELFILRLARAAREAWGLEVPSPLMTARGNHSIVAYAVDELILRELERKVTEDPSILPRPEPPEAPRDLEEARRRAAERKVEHARKLLELHERKQRREARLVAKWRRSLNRYEKIAAKRNV